MSKKQLIGIIGALLIIIGVFMPMVSIPLIGGISFISKNKIGGIIVVILAIASIVLILKNNYKGLLGTGIASICVIIFYTVKMVYSFNKAKEEMGDNYLADMVSDFINIEYGVPVLIIALVLVIVAAVIKNDEKNSEEKIVESAPSDVE